LHLVVVKFKNVLLYRSSGTYLQIALGVIWLVWEMVSGWAQSGKDKLVFPAGHV
jgi:hypothetical protein